MVSEPSMNYNFYTILSVENDDVIMWGSPQYNYKFWQFLLVLNTYWLSFLIHSAIVVWNQNEVARQVQINDLLPSDFFATMPNDILGRLAEIKFTGISWNIGWMLHFPKLFAVVLNQAEMYEISMQPI